MRRRASARSTFKMWSKDQTTLSLPPSKICFTLAHVGMYGHTPPPTAQGRPRTYWQRGGGTLFSSRGGGAYRGGLGSGLVGRRGVCSDEGVEEGQASVPGLGCGGVKGGGGEVRKRVLEGNPWVGGGDGKIIPPGLEDVPWKAEGGVVLLFTKVKFLKGDHVSSQGEGDKVVHRVHLAHTLPRLTLPLPPHNPQKTIHRLLPRNKPKG